MAERPAGTLAKPRFINANMAAICTRPTLSTMGRSERAGSLMRSLREAWTKNRLTAPNAMRMQANQSGLM